MYIFTPNTLIESAKVNANFDEQTARLDDMFFEEIARSTLTSTSDTVSVTDIPDRAYLRVHFSLFQSGAITSNFRFNNDSSANYTHRYIVDGTAGSATGQSIIGSVGSSAADMMGFMTIKNISTRMKYARISCTFGGTDTGIAPGYVEFWAKWVNTSSSINRIDIINTNTGDYAAGSEIIVTGHN